ncbi:MAG: type IV pilin N-terminal domain-containing protein, partial [Methanocorpusculum sp.]|nr:type IV pilin N-terminal domain-containing protein [Methanocorpusculum sp.]
MSVLPPTDNDGVSPVIASILIVALTVVLVGASAAIFVGFSSSVPEAAPAVGIAIELSGTNVLVRHQNGAVLPAGRYAVKVDGAEKDFQPAGVDFTPGMTLKWDAGDTAVGTVSVVAKDGAGETSLAQKYIGKAAPAVGIAIELS